MLEPVRLLIFKIRNGMIGFLSRDSRTKKLANKTTAIPPKMKGVRRAPAVGGAVTMA